MLITRHLPRFRRAARELPALAVREAWSRERIEAYQLERLNRLWSHARETVPHYRGLQAAGLPDRFADLAEYRSTVPVLRRSDVRAGGRAFLSESAGRGSWHRTGGSTGAPVPVYWSADGHHEVLRHQYRFFQAWGVDLFDRVAFLWGHSASFAPGLHGVLARLHLPVTDRLRNRLRLSAYEMGREDLRRHLVRLQSFRPRMLYGYATAVWLLAEEAAAMGLSLPDLQLVVLTSEPTSPARIDTIERSFGARVAIEYGSVEAGLIAHTWLDGTLRIRGDLCMVETLPREDGRYDIVVTTLANNAYPLLRYAIGDVTDAPREAPDMGFGRLHNVIGRDMDLVVRADGSRVHPTRIEAEFEQDPAIRRYRVHQREDGSLRVLVEPSNGRVDTTRIAEALERVVRYPADVDVVDAIPLTAAGKHRLVTSQFQASVRDREVAPH